LFHRDPEFDGSFVLGVLSFAGFDGGRYLIHDPITHSKGELGAAQSGGELR
jgi:hypothetical protein